MEYTKKESDFCFADYIGKDNDFEEKTFTAVFRSKCEISLAPPYDIPVRQLMERYKYLQSIRVNPDVTRRCIDTVMLNNDYPCSVDSTEEELEENFNDLIQGMEEKGELDCIKKKKPYGYGLIAVFE